MPTITFIELKKILVPGRPPNQAMFDIKFPSLRLSIQLSIVIYIEHYLDMYPISHFQTKVSYKAQLHVLLNTVEISVI